MFEILPDVGFNEVLTDKNAVFETSCMQYTREATTVSVAYYTTVIQGPIWGFGLGGALAGGLGTEVSLQRGSGAEPQWGLGAIPQKPEKCYAMRLIKPLTEREKTSPYRLTLYDNIITINLSSHHSSFSVSSHFCLKIQNSNNFWFWLWCN